jgi:hypothetical protein
MSSVKNTAPGSWWSGRNPEFYTSGPHDTREEAILAGREEFEGQGFYIVEAAMIEIRLSASRLLDDQYFDSDELFHEDGREPDRCGNHKAADAELQDILNAWLLRHRDTFVAPSKFAWTRGAEFIPAGAVSDELEVQHDG